MNYFEYRKRNQELFNEWEELNQKAREVFHEYRMKIEEVLKPIYDRQTELCVEMDKLDELWEEERKKL